MTFLLLTSSADLRAEVGRLAAAAGVEPTVTTNPHEALAGWAGADGVLVGADLAQDLADLAPARRSGVHVVAMSAATEVFRAAVSLGAEAVIDLPQGSNALVSLFADVGEPETDGRLVGIVGGAGGVGATTVACALAQAGAIDGRALLVDTDPWGPGLDRLVGLDETSGVRWSDLHATSGRLSSRALRETVPRRDGLGVLTWAGPGTSLHPDTVRHTLAAARRGHDLVVVDLPRRGDALTSEVVGRCDLVLVVARSTLAGLSAAARVVEGLGLRGRSAGVVLRPGRVPRDDFGEVIGMPVLAEVGDQRGLADALDLGAGPLVQRRGPLARAVDHLLSA